MRTKSISQLWEQIERIRGYFDNPNQPGQSERLNKACDICNRYTRKAFEYINTTPDADKRDDEKFNIPVPVEILTK